MLQLCDLSDNRFSGLCVYCGRRAGTRDHVPSRVLLDEPFPTNLPVVLSCEDCNLSFSLDEAYLACLIDAIRTGSTLPGSEMRSKVRRILEHNPLLAARIERNKVANSSGLFWQPELDRVRSVVLKLARGHAAFEFGEARLEEPEDVDIIPLVSMSAAERTGFERSPASGLWPEVGSRAMQRLVVTWPQDDGGWLEVQRDRYRYAVGSQCGLTVRLVLSEYLACRVSWCRIEPT